VFDYSEGNSRNVFGSKIRNLKFAIQTAKNKSRSLDKEIAYDEHAEKNIMQNKHAKILNDTIFKSEENVRISQVVDIAANRTANFSVPVLDFTPTQYGECGLFLNITCGDSCCPNRFPVCGGCFSIKCL
jgi:hypothetical protein